MLLSLIDRLGLHPCPEIVTTFPLSNKFDLTSQCKVIYARGSMHSKENNLLFMKISALTNSNASKVLLAVD